MSTTSTTHAGGMPLSGAFAAALAAEHGTPFYLYDMDAAVAHLARLRQHLPAWVDVLYCMKANANRVVLQAFAPHVAGIDISSAGELDLAVAAGHSPSKMSFAGPGKTLQELERAISAGLHLLSLESVAELHRAARVCARLGKRQDVTLRVNPLHMPKEFAMKMGGGASQFGVAEEDAGAALAAIAAEPRVRLAGLHVFAGTQCLEESAILENLRGTLEIARRLADEHDLAPEVVNLGGGFGIPYFAGQTEMDVEALSRGVAETLVAFRGQHAARFGRTRFILELGRYLIGMYGAYVARVTEVKETRGKRFVILDGGMHHCYPATGNFGQVMKKNYPVRNLTRGGGAELEGDVSGEPPQELCGPLCTPMDSMARAVKIAQAEPGDLIAFLHSGAYSYAASPLLFLSHDTPLELVKTGGQVVAARARMPATRFS